MTTTAKKTRTRKPQNDAEIRVRINAKTKAKAARLFKRHGLSTSDGMRLLIDAALNDKDLPHVPNARTQKALNECRRGLAKSITLDDLERQWNEA